MVGSIPSGGRSGRESFGTRRFGVPGRSCGDFRASGANVIDPSARRYTFVADDRPSKRLFVRMGRCLVEIFLLRRPRPMARGGFRENGEQVEISGFGIERWCYAANKKPNNQVLAVGSG